MAFPIKTHETMDLARLMQEEDISYERRETGSEHERERSRTRNDNPDPGQFDNMTVVTKDSSTELIPTQNVDNNRPAFMMRDLNAGRGMIDDDGKPVVGKVFSRVLGTSGSTGISGFDSKSKQILKARRSRKDDMNSCSTKDSKKECSVGRPHSSGTNNRGG